MTKSYYDVSSLSRVLAQFEEHFGMTSEEFAAIAEGGETVPGVPGFHRHVWLSFYRDVQRLSGDRFAHQAERVLTLA